MGGLSVLVVSAVGDLSVVKERAYLQLRHFYCLKLAVVESEVVALSSLPSVAAGTHTVICTVIQTRHLGLLFLNVKRT